MKTMQKIIHAGFAICAMASASMPALSWTVWPNIDFEWYADVGKPPADTDDHPQQVARYTMPAGTQLATSPDADASDASRR